MNSDRVEGKLKETEGEAQQAWGEVKEKAGDIGEKADEMWSAPRRRSRTSPLRASRAGAHRGTGRECRRAGVSGGGATRPPRALIRATV